MTRQILNPRKALNKVIHGEPGPIGTCFRKGSHFKRKIAIADTPKLDLEVNELLAKGINTMGGGKG